MSKALAIVLRGISINHLPSAKALRFGSASQISSVLVIQVSKEVASSWCKEKDISYFEVSAKNNINVVQAFETLARQALSRVSCKSRSGTCPERMCMCTFVPMTLAADIVLPTCLSILPDRQVKAHNITGAIKESIAKALVCS